jgi:hypothetical protein
MVGVGNKHVDMGTSLRILFGSAHLGDLVTHGNAGIYIDKDVIR